MERFCLWHGAGTYDHEQTRYHRHSLFLAERPAFPGAVLMRTAAFARRFGAAYRTVALLVLNTLVLLLVIEVVSALILAARPAEPTLAQRVQTFKDKMLRLEYYYGQDWSKAYWDEHMRAVDHWQYQPYTLWRTRPFDGELINVD